MGGSDVSPSLSLRLAMAGAWWALKGRGPEGRGPEGRVWGRLLALLEAVGGGAPELLRPRHRARLSLGLRAQVVTSLLQELGPSPTVLDALDWLFPEEAGPGAGHALGMLQGRPLVAVAEEHFREQVLGILGSGRGLEPFLQFPFPGIRVPLPGFPPESFPGIFASPGERPAPPRPAPAGAALPKPRPSWLQATPSPRPAPLFDRGWPHPPRTGATPTSGPQNHAHGEATPPAPQAPPAPLLPFPR
ncbi:uncharacterized protein [Chamaea fasciata]|uniref:uncharacterized protein isoform X4 n=1 Tax=Chamaea fasciata TaxID=190680 RepID=UPI003369E11E